jgi:hypothetical protein
MDARNPFPFYRFRTLFIAMGVYTPLPRVFFAKGHSHTLRRGLVALQQKPFISFFLTSLRTLSFTTRGVHPLPQVAGSGEGEGRQNAQ